MPSILAFLRKSFCACAVLAFCSAGLSQAQTSNITTSYSFAGGTDGQSPSSPLILASDGFYYGMTSEGGGTSGAGSLYKYAEGPGTLTSLHDFDGMTEGKGGQAIVEGADGNIYGATYPNSNGNGIFFKWDTHANKFTSLATFGSEAYQVGGLTLGSDGNFYGTSIYGGNNANGSVLQLTPSGTVTLLASLTGVDGGNPLASLTELSPENFVGTASQIGGNNDGSVFSVEVSSSGGTPTASVNDVHDFSGTDGAGPETELVAGPGGTLFGATSGAGAGGNGTVFTLNSALTSFHTIYSFPTDVTHTGFSPNTFELAGDGNFYFATQYGPGGGNAASFLEMTPAGAVTVLWDGSTTASMSAATLEAPVGWVTEAQTGDFYGVSQQIGAHNDGSIFQAVNSSLPEAAIQLSSSTATPAVGTAFALSYAVKNGYSLSAQQCYAFVQGGKTGAGTWTGKLNGTAGSGGWSGSASVTVTAAGTYTYAITCAGRNSAFVTVTAGGSSAASTTTALSISPNPVTVGSPATIKATVTSAGGTPTGNVSFYNAANNTSLDTVALSGGAASFIYTPNTAQSLQIYAKYAGNSSFAASQSPTQTLTALASSTTTVSITPGVVYAKDAFDVDVSVTSGGSAVSGQNVTITFSQGSSTVYTVTNQTDSAGNLKELVSTSKLNGVGSYTVQATFAGSAPIAASHSGLTLNVINYPTYAFSSLAANSTTVAAQWAGGPIVQADDGNFWSTFELYDTDGDVIKVSPSGTDNSYLFKSSAHVNFATNDGFLEDTDGNFYGVTGSAASAVSFTPGFVNKALNVDLFNPQITNPLTSRLLPGTDGKLYGFATDTSHTYFYSMNRDGSSPTSLATFNGTDWGGFAVLELTPGYFIGDVNNSSEEHIFVCNNGSCSGLYDLTSNRYNIYQFIEGADGMLYAMAQQPLQLLRLDLGGWTSLQTYSSGELPSRLYLASDRHFYSYSQTSASGEAAYDGGLLAVGLDGKTDQVAAPQVQGGFGIVSSTGTTAMQGSDGNFYQGADYLAAQNGSSSYTLGVFRYTPSSKLAAPVQVSASASTVTLGKSVTLSWQVLNAFSASMQTCFALSTGNEGGSAWNGLQHGTLVNNLYTGSANVTPTVTGTITYSLTCGGYESGFVQVNVTSPSITTTTTVSISPNPVPVNSTATVKVKVTSTSGTPSGSVTLSAGPNSSQQQSLGTVALGSDGTATVPASTAGYAPGKYVLIASYAGSGSFASSSGQVSVNLTAGKANSTTTVTANPATVAPGGTVTLTATVNGTSPSGTVTFTGFGTTLGSASIASGKASIMVTLPSSGVPLGSYTATASYGGDAANNASSGNTTVNVRQATVKVTVTPSTIHQGDNVTLSAIVTGGGASAKPTGTVTFKAYGITIHSVTLVNGSGSYQYNDVESPVTGPITIEGDYSGDSNFPAASGTATVTVE